MADDSLGDSAKYCSYTIMSLATYQTVASELTQVSQASISVAMEKLGFSKCVEKIGETNRIGLIATDRHVGIRKLLKDDYFETDHQSDVWHLCKQHWGKINFLIQAAGVKQIGPMDTTCGKSVENRKSLKCGLQWFTMYVIFILAIMDAVMKTGLKRKDKMVENTIKSPRGSKTQVKKACHTDQLEVFHS